MARLIKHFESGGREGGGGTANFLPPATLFIFENYEFKFTKSGMAKSDKFWSFFYLLQLSLCPFLKIKDTFCHFKPLFATVTLYIFEN